MYPQDHVPIQIGTPTPDKRQLKRHHTARYYMHRVQESLTTRVSKFICAIFLGLLFFAGIIAFIVYLSLRPHRPRFLIEQFSLPALAQPNGFENAELTFNVTARNSNHKIGIYYADMVVNAFYDDQSIGGRPVLYPFYQEPKNSTIIFGTLSGATLTVNNRRWMQFLADRSRGKVMFRLEITSTIRFKISTWDSKRHKMHANCQVEVGSDGLMMASFVGHRCPTYFT
ncbi:NDR1/HIN1-like protein 26 [Apium graveolens]|uniref:NDR1/HIN1-like protein 26 n=1 Tax=Apium graveolens TaxID=4045 RepID=UPI003D78BAAF